MLFTYLLAVKPPNLPKLSSPQRPLEDNIPQCLNRLGEMMVIITCRFFHRADISSNKSPTSRTKSETTS